MPASWHICARVKIFIAPEVETPFPPILILHIRQGLRRLGSFTPLWLELNVLAGVGGGPSGHEALPTQPSRRTLGYSTNAPLHDSSLPTAWLGGKFH